ncbi:MAG: segregation/condensation protein A [Planctomycetes bacterium]|nr:segregation/condensation protein A [Planctomycetota bacterium]
MTYKVDLDVYNGPMDLLLYLIRREEVEITDLPIARIADQYIAYLDVLQGLDIELAGDFVVMAATLLELKSRALLPRPPEIEEDTADEEDPRETLIRQLIEYRRFKEVAGLLDDRGRDMARRFPRQFDEDLLGRLETPGDAAEEPPDDVLQGIEVWDLIGAFSTVIRTLGYSRPREVIYDDTPQEELAQDLLARLETERSVQFTQLFAGGRTVNYCVTMFLAVLELIRQRRIGVEQSADFKDFHVFLRDPAAEEPPKPVRPKGARESSDALRRKHPRRPSSRQVGQVRGMMDEVEIEKTEFDEILDSIVVPDVETFKPIYSEDEILGRPEAEAADTDTADSAGTAEAAAEAAGESAAVEDPADADAPDADTPSEDAASDEAAASDEPSADGAAGDEAAASDEAADDDERP